MRNLRKTVVTGFHGGGWLMLSLVLTVTMIALPTAIADGKAKTIQLSLAEDRGHVSTKVETAHPSLQVGKEDPLSEEQAIPYEAGKEPAAPEKQQVGMEEAVEHEDHLMPASELLGHEVQNTQGKEIGKVDDLIVHQETGKVPYIVVLFGGPVAVERGEFAMPWDRLQHRHEGDTSILSLEIEEGIPFKEQKNWIKLRGLETTTRIGGDFGMGPYTIENVLESDGVRKEDHFKSELSTSSILGSKIVDRAGEDLGKLSELMIGMGNGQVAYAVVRYGGFLGIGSENRAIPWEVLMHSKEKRQFVAQIDRTQLESAPVFESADDPTSRSIEMASRVRDSFELESLAKPGRVMESQPAAMPLPNIAMIDNNPDLLSAGHLVGAPIIDSNGEEVGRIESIPVDPKTAEVICVLISCSGALEDDGRLRASPFSALMFDEAKGTFSISLTKEQFRQAPSFDRKEWPNLRDQEWSQRVQDFYQQSL